MEKVLVFIDAGFLSKLGKHFGGGIPIKYNILKFVKQLVGKEKMIFKHLFYYTAPPYQSNKPNESQKKRKERYDSFIKKLSLEQEITIHEGRCQRIKENGFWKYKQKGVDTLLTMGLMDVPLTYPKIQKIILIASDSDFVPIINRLQKLEIEIILYTYFDKKRNSIFSTSNKLLNSVTRYVQLCKEDFNKAKN